MCLADGESVRSEACNGQILRRGAPGVTVFGFVRWRNVLSAGGKRQIRGLQRSDTTPGVTVFGFVRYLGLGVDRGVPVGVVQHHLRSRVPDSGFRVQGSGFRVQGSGFRVQGRGDRVRGRERDAEPPRARRDQVPGGKGVNCSAITRSRPAARPRLLRARPGHVLY